MTKDIEKEKKIAATEAVKLLHDNMIVGLGTGSSAIYAINEIGDFVKKGLKIKAVATSNRTAELAESLNIPLIDINTVNAIDITIDGADEFTTDLILIKGGGGALLKEKIVASLTKEEIIITDSSKKVDLIGKFKVPIEVIPFAYHYVIRQIESLHGVGVIRMDGDKLFTTDQGNYIVDADFGLISDPTYLSQKLNEIEGLVAHGIFIGLTSKIIMGNNDSIVVFEAK